MSQYLSPGVFVEEVSGGQKPIEAVSTSLAGFVGAAPNKDAHRGEAVGITNWSQFLREFAKEGSASTDLSHAVYGFFQNGGARCYVVNVGSDPIAGGGRGERTGLALLETIDEIAIVAAPGYTDASSYSALLTHCEKLRDRVAIIDGPKRVVDVEVLTRVATPKKAGAAEPDAASGKPASEAKKKLGMRAPDSVFGAFYVPWLVVADPLDGGRIVEVPPSGHLAGIYGRTDATRGVHKAPANEAVRGALDLTMRITRSEQDMLNPRGVNCIRFFPRQGIRVWGARTLSSDPEWCYISVRRLFNMIEESIQESTSWVVLEPNDMTLWKKITRDVSAFLMRLWRSGALLGATPEQAFFVKCDAETNPPEVIDAGEVVTVIGICPVKPAEFIIFRVGQGMGKTSNSEADSGGEA